MSMELGPYSNFHELNQDWFLSEFDKVLKKWADMQKSFTSLNQAFNDLHDYVHDYFKNLNVQKEIDNKLVAMAKDGSLYEIIRKYTDPIVNKQNEKIIVLENRMNTFTSLPEGSTAGNAELVDIRIPAIDFNENKPYPSAGDAVRRQIGKLYEDSSEIYKKTFDWVDKKMFNFEGYIDLNVDTFSCAKIDVSSFVGFRIYITTYTAYNGTYVFFSEPFDREHPMKWKKEKNENIW